MRFYKCEHCGNVIHYMTDNGVPVMCCGELMKELIPGTSDGAAEKHVPVVKKEANKLQVFIGEIAHPMVENHYIEWILLETVKGMQCVFLQPGDTPYAEFLVADGDQAVAAYEYCNLHGLWKAEITA